MRLKFFSLKVLTFVISTTLNTLIENTGLEPDQQFFVEKLTYQSDISLSKEEFYHLTDLKEGTASTLRHLANSYKQLKQKKRALLIHRAKMDYV